MMFNFDMIGWLRDDALQVLSWNSSPQFGPVLDKHGEALGLNIQKPRIMVGGSDHMPFDGRKIPNLFFHTGLHEVYHTPEDTYDAINCEGAVRVIDYSEKVIEEMMAMDKRPVYGPPAQFQLGVTLVDQNNNMTIEAIAENSAAQRAGLMVGDVILEVNEQPIATRRALSLAIRQLEGKTVKFKLKRDDAEVILHVELVNKSET
jgi:S1-C subfamily serine protease